MLAKNQWDTYHIAQDSTSSVSLVSFFRPLYFLNCRLVDAGSHGIMPLNECGGLREDAYSGLGIFVRMKMVVDLILGDGDWCYVWWLDYGFMAQIHVSQRLGVLDMVVLLPK